MTFLTICRTTDTTFIDNPTTFSKVMSKSQGSASLSTRGHHRGANNSGQRFAARSGIGGSQGGGYARVAKPRGAHER